VLWLLVDVAVVLLAVLVLVVVCLALWKRVKRLKGDVDRLADLAAQASEAVASVQR